jgi:hypothetical protein
MAIVAGTNTVRLAEAFAATAGTDRPVRVFKSIHEARAWLASEAISPLR